MPVHMVHRRRLGRRHFLEAPNGRLQEPAVELVAHRGDVAALGAVTEKVLKTLKIARHIAVDECDPDNGATGSAFQAPLDSCISVTIH